MLSLDDTTTQTRSASRSVEQIGSASLPGSIASLGRYLVIEQVGEGGMGRVLRAYDPKLEREVALKVLRTNRIDEPARGRMLREARVMAKLGHPNVVAVYDVDLDPSEGVVLAMEYVRGTTLRAWLRERERSWREIVDVFCAAGRGLAAAHAAEILHRDFKPANVLVGADGRVRVTDFGLAKTGDAPLEVVSTEGPRTGPDHGAQPEVFTTSGAIMGTPRYMAPEQYEATALTPAADQYSFCVSLWEALAGEAPFRGEDRLSQKRRGPPPWPPEVAVPPAVAAALARGLAPAPGQRWPSMASLLEALTRTLVTRRWHAVGITGIAGAFVLGGAGLHAWMSNDSAHCSGAPAQLTEVWDEARRAEVGRVFSGLGSALARDTWEDLAPRLDAYAGEWSRAYTETCEATVVRAEQSVEAMDLRMACLQRVRLELRAATTVLTSADAELVPKAHELVDRLPPLRSCEDLAALRTDVPPPPPHELAAVDRARSELADARALEAAGRYSAARQSLDRAVSRLEGVGYGPVRTEVALLRGIVLDDLGEYEAAEAASREALRLALRWGQPSRAMSAALGLSTVLNVRLARLDEATLALEVAQGLVARSDDPLDWSRYHQRRGAMLKTAGRYAEAEEANRLALEQYERARGPDDPGLMGHHRTLASILRIRGRLAESERELRRALELGERYRGLHHPIVADMLVALGSVLDVQGRSGEAEPLLRRGLDIRTQTMGPRHPLVADVCINLGNALFRRGELEEAEAMYRRALDIHLQTHGVDHPSVAIDMGSLANVLLIRGRTAEAEPLLRRTLVQFERTLEPEHEHMLIARSNLGFALLDLGRFAEAAVEYREFLESTRRSLGSDHPTLITAHVQLARALLGAGEPEDAEHELRAALDLGERRRGSAHPETMGVRDRLAKVLLHRNRPDEARALLEQTWSHYAGEPPATATEANTAFLLARALWSTKAGRPRALELARRAERVLGDGSSGHRDALAEVQAWLRAR